MNNSFNLVNKSSFLSHDVLNLIGNMGKTDICGQSDLGFMLLF